MKTSAFTVVVFLSQVECKALPANSYASCSLLYLWFKEFKTSSASRKFTVELLTDRINAYRIKHTLFRKVALLIRPLPVFSDTGLRSRLLPESAPLVALIHGADIKETKQYYVI